MALLLADKGSDANVLRNTVTKRKSSEDVPSKIDRKELLQAAIAQSHRKLLKNAKHFRRIATPLRKVALPQTRGNSHLAIQK
ncbi:hypothetical protein [Mesorhizobium sp. INR15]|uniref:hypothetical protein n=1 Tax=Mesorhizobium sp. INR15 TaxID=2654248 RepID=UPI0018969B49|nr:hypothetical protein [Mesorhizobium sp. INR15]QPC95851.1 hypothetical protein GA829_35520 [Mesorhizobium sp. INR15]